MKKLLGIVTLFAFLFTASPMPASAAVKPGASCSYESQQAKVGSKRYACYYSGSKLIWSMPLVAKTTTSFCTKENGPLGNLDSYSSCTVHLTAKSELLKILKTNKVEAPLKLITDPSVSKAWLAKETSRVNDAYGFWSPTFKPTEVTYMYWLLRPSSKLEWANKIFLPIQGNTNGGAPIQSLDPNNCQAAAAADFGKGSEHNYFVQTCAGETSSSKAFKPVHEYTHLVQYSLHMNNNAPVWIVEGSADYYGTILGNGSVSTSLLNTHYKEYAKWLPDVSSWSKAKWISAITKLESPRGDSTYSYYLGGVLTELLVGLYGHDKFVSFMKTYESAPDTRLGPQRAPSGFFAEKFESIYGLTPEVFYDKAYTYVKEIAKRYESLK